MNLRANGEAIDMETLRQGGLGAVSRRGALAGVAAGLVAGRRARAAVLPIRIGVLADESSYASDVGGPGSTVAARMAVADFGGSVLGLPIEVLHADTQTKPDVAGAVARRWFDEGVDMITDLPATPVAAAVVQAGKDKNRTVIITAAAAEEFVSKWCTPITVMWADDTHALAVGSVMPTVQAGRKTWFFITVDIAFGTSLEREATTLLTAHGGRVLGSARYPQNNSDFSAQLLQAQSSGAEVIGLTSVGNDTVNVVKQANEFGLTRGGRQSLVGFLVNDPEIHALGLETAQGLVFSASFYWDMNDKTRAFSKRFRALHPMPPSKDHGQVYSAVTHYLKALAAAGSRDTIAVGRAMRGTPAEYFGQTVPIREDGRVLFATQRWRVKAPSESKYPWDYLDHAGTIAAADAFGPMTAACKLY